MAGKVLASALAGAMLGVVLAASPALAQATAADSQFVEKAGSGGLAEVQLGKLASKNGYSAQVKQFGRRMVTDHGKANLKLKTAARSAGLTPPTALLTEQQDLADRLSKLSGETFDTAYMAAMLDDHKEDVTLFQKQAEGDGPAALKRLASQTLPVLEQHLGMAKQVASKIGVDTATAGTLKLHQGK